MSFAAVFCGSQTKPYTQEEPATDRTQQSCNQGPLLKNLAAGVYAQCIQHLLIDLSNTRDL